MNTRFEKSVRSSDEWYTPKEILDALGKFDLDPCAPIRPLWPTAEVMYDQNIDGLSQIWEGRVAQSSLFASSYRAIRPETGRTWQRHCIIIQPL